MLAFVGGGGGEKKTPLKFCIPDSYIHEAEGEEEKEEKNIEWIEGISWDITCYHKNQIYYHLNWCKALKSEILKGNKGKAFWGY